MTLGSGLAIASGCATVCALAIWAPHTLALVIPMMIICLGLGLLAWCR